jgi:hypothetical protein
MKAIHFQLTKPTRCVTADLWDRFGQELDRVQLEFNNRIDDAGTPIWWELREWLNATRQRSR